MEKNNAADNSIVKGANKCDAVITERANSAPNVAKRERLGARRDRRSRLDDLGSSNWCHIPAKTRMKRGRGKVRGSERR